MKTENLIYFLYIIPIIMSYSSFLYTARIYGRLPDKLPMNFGFNGKPQKWWSKNKFSAYLLPTISLLITQFMGLLLYVIHLDTGPLPDDFGLAFWFFDFSLVYLLIKSQQAILEYNELNQKSFWPTMNKGFFLLGLAIVGLIALIFINTQPNIKEAIFSENVIDRQPINIRQKFSSRDPRVYLLLRMQNIKGEHLVRTEWIDPKGNLYFQYQHKTHHKILAKYMNLWSYINIKPGFEGQWTSRVYINGEQVLSKEFVMTE